MPYWIFEMSHAGLATTRLPIRYCKRQMTHENADLLLCTAKRLISGSAQLSFARRGQGKLRCKSTATGRSCSKANRRLMPCCQCSTSHVLEPTSGLSRNSKILRDFTMAKMVQKQRQKQWMINSVVPKSIVFAMFLLVF